MNTLASKKHQICHFERNPDPDTTIRAGLNPKHVDERARIVQETTNNISQIIRCRWGRIGPITGESFGRGASRGKVSPVPIVIPLDSLHKMICLDSCLEKQGTTHRSKRVCLGWVTWVIPIHVHIWNLRSLRIQLCVTPSVRNILLYHTITIAYWRGRVIVCRIVIGSVDVCWILHFTLHSYRLSDVLPMDTFPEVASHMRVLKYDTHA